MVVAPYKLVILAATYNTLFFHDTKNSLRLILRLAVQIGEKLIFGQVTFIRLMRLALAIPALLIAVSFSHAYGAFDSSGNYFCNASNLPLEQTIYKSSVTKLDSEMNAYLSDNPSATDQELHSYMISSPDLSEPYSVMEQSKACLQSNGVNPVAVALPSSLLLEVFAAPEFGIVSSIVFGVTLASVVLIQKKINASVLLKY